MIKILYVWIIAATAMATVPKCYTWKELQDRGCRMVCVDRQKDTGTYDVKKKACLCGEYVTDGKPITITEPLLEDLSDGWFDRVIMELKPENKQDN